MLSIDNHFTDLAELCLSAYQEQWGVKVGVVLPQVNFLLISVAREKTRMNQWLKRLLLECLYYCILLTH